MQYLKQKYDKNLKLLALCKILYTLTPQLKEVLKQYRTKIKTTSQQKVEKYAKAKWYML